MNYACLKSMITDYTRPRMATTLEHKMRDTYQDIETGIEIDADFSQSASPIRWRPIDEDEERWRGTPFQTADARHNPNDAIQMIEEWLGMQG